MLCGGGRRTCWGDMRCVTTQKRSVFALLISMMLAPRLSGILEHRTTVRIPLKKGGGLQRPRLIRCRRLGWSILCVMVSKRAPSPSLCLSLRHVSAGDAKTSNEEEVKPSANRFLRLFHIMQKDRSTLDSTDRPAARFASGHGCNQVAQACAYLCAMHIHSASD